MIRIDPVALEVAAAASQSPAVLHPFPKGCSTAEVAAVAADAAAAAVAAAAAACSHYTDDNRKHPEPG